jgi:hypothetical protein
MGTGWFLNRDKASLDICWLREERLEESENLPNPDVLAQEIVVPRLASLGTTPSIRPSRVLGRGVEDFEAALETILRNRHRKRSIDAFNSIFV